MPPLAVPHWPFVIIFPEQVTGKHRLSAPLVTGLQVPGDAPRLHAMHAPLQSLLQQTLSAQKVLLHCPLLLQLAPLSSLALQVPSQ